MAFRRPFLCHGLPVTGDSRRLNFYEVRMEPHAQTSTWGPCLYIRNFAQNLSGIGATTSSWAAAGFPFESTEERKLHHPLNKHSTAWSYHQESYTYLCPIYLFILIPCLLQSVRRHLVTFVSIALEACRRYFQRSSPILFSIARIDVVSGECCWVI